MAAEERLKAARDRREAVRKAFQEALLEQQALDTEALVELEEKHGFGRVLEISIASCWKVGAGAPASVAVEVPSGSSKLAQRFIQQINRSKEGSPERLTAQDALAESCWLYPPKESDGYRAALELAPLILNTAAVQIVRAAQGVAEEEGKG